MMIRTKAIETAASAIARIYSKPPFSLEQDTEWIAGIIRLAAEIDDRELNADRELEIITALKKQPFISRTDRRRASVMINDPENAAAKAFAWAEELEEELNELEQILGETNRRQGR